MNEQQKKLYEFLTSGQLSAEEVVNALTDYHGTDILSEGFAEHLVDEGLAAEEEVGIESVEDDDTDDYDPDSDDKEVEDEDL